MGKPDFVEMDFLKTPEIAIGDFLVPWGMVIGTMGFLAAWVFSSALEHAGLTRRIWQLPLFFVATAVLFGCVLGLILAP